MSVVFLGLGSNLGDKEGYIKQALRLLSQRCTIKKISHLYLTEPVGNTNQDWFLNGAVEIETDMEPKRLLSFLKTIERTLGRLKTLKNGPRTIDLDILFYGNRIVKTKNLVIPHPSLQDRLFVLQPLMDLAPSFIHPVFNKSIQELYTSHQGKEKVQLYQ
ncbi:MAG: 2-amino-4-hydroxy-6-hydroxymethyldihydropteridine diphosphokinase [Candidatus Thermoplasmatota archaeon]|nr:2-amino-4-hydroxy-6-hydroxymethyldihydropteridine diphosphokinase [Candidatus Thermoplasmatota archaeon]